MLAIAAMLTAALAGATAPPPERPPDVHLTIGVSGDLLPHLRVVARARALARGRGYDFQPLLRPIRGWVRSNDLTFCHIETPLAPGPPVGYRCFGRRRRSHVRSGRPAS